MNHMQQLDPKAVWLFFIITGLPWVGIILVMSSQVIIGLAILKVAVNISIPASAFVTAILIALPIVLVPAIGFWVWAKLAYHFYRYELTESGFKKELGIIWKKYVAIPYDQIQNVDVHRGIIARLLGLSDLQIQTAGGTNQPSSAEARLPGLSREVAEQLRNEFLRRAQQTTVKTSSNNLTL